MQVASIRRALIHISYNTKYYIITFMLEYFIKSNQ
jgi:hypothetical protein